MTETGVIDMNSYASISIMALVCYLYLFLALAASEKTRLIRSFMLLLAAMILWTGGSFAMRMQFGPSVRFWYVFLYWDSCFYRMYFIILQRFSVVGQGWLLLCMAGFFRCYEYHQHTDTFLSGSSAACESAWGNGLSI